MDMDCREKMAINSFNFKDIVYKKKVGLTNIYDQRQKKVIIKYEDGNKKWSHTQKECYCDIRQGTPLKQWQQPF